MSLDRTSESGAAALITVLWVGVLVVALALGFAFFARTEIRATGLASGQVRTAQILQAGVARVRADLLLPETRAVIPRTGERYRVRTGDAVLAVRLTNANARMDLNAAPDVLVKGLFATLFPDDPGAVDLADRLLDWRDNDESLRPGGAERRDYALAGSVSRPRNGAFHSVSDLHDVLGLTPEHIAMLAPHVTVYNLSRKVNAALATEATLRALPGVSASDVETVRSRRNAEVLVVPQAMRLWHTPRVSQGWRAEITAEAVNGLEHIRTVQFWVSDGATSLKDVLVLEARDSQHTSP